MGDYYLFYRSWEGFAFDFPYEQFDSLDDDELMKSLEELTNRWLEEHPKVKHTIEIEELSGEYTSIEDIWKKADWIGWTSFSATYECRPGRMNFFYEVGSQGMAQRICKVLQIRLGGWDRYGCLCADHFDKVKQLEIRLQIQDNESKRCAQEACRIEDFIRKEENPSSSDVLAACTESRPVLDEKDAMINRWQKPNQPRASRDSGGGSPSKYRRRRHRSPVTSEWIYLADAGPMYGIPASTLHSYAKQLPSGSVETDDASPQIRVKREDLEDLLRKKGRLLE